MEEKKRRINNENDVGEEIKKYYIPDIESGTSYQVSKEHYDAYIRAWNLFRPKIDSIKGVPIIMGIGGDINMGSEDLEKLFYNPNNKNEEI